MSKWMEKLTRQTDKYNPRKRKQYKKARYRKARYRKARYRKQARKFEEWCEKEEAWAEEFERLHPNWVAEADRILLE